MILRVPSNPNHSMIYLPKVSQPTHSPLLQLLSKRNKCYNSHFISSCIKKKKKNYDKCMTGIWDLTVSSYIYSTKSEKLNSSTCSGWEWCRKESSSIAGSNIFCSFRKRREANLYNIYETIVPRNC